MKKVKNKIIDKVSEKETYKEEFPYAEYIGDFVLTDGHTTITADAEFTSFYSYQKVGSYGFKFIGVFSNTHDDNFTKSMQSLLESETIRFIFKRDKIRYFGNVRFVSAKLIDEEFGEFECSGLLEVCHFEGVEVFKYDEFFMDNYIKKIVGECDEESSNAFDFIEEQLSKNKKKKQLDA